MLSNNSSTAAGRVHFRCLTCNSVTCSQPGPHSKSSQKEGGGDTEGNGHANGRNGLITGGVFVNGDGNTIIQQHFTNSTSLYSSPFSSASTSLSPSLSSPSAAASLLGASRAHMLIDVGSPLTVYGVDKQVYRGRGDTHVVFMPPGASDDTHFTTVYNNNSGVFNSGSNSGGALMSARPMTSPNENMTNINASGAVKRAAGGAVNRLSKQNANGNGNMNGVQYGLGAGGGGGGGGSSQHGGGRPPVGYSYGVGNGSVSARSANSSVLSAAGSYSINRENNGGTDSNGGNKMATNNNINPNNNSINISNNNASNSNEENENNEYKDNSDTL